MRKKIIGFTVVLFYTLPLFSQGLFESLTAESVEDTEKKSQLEFSGYARGSFYGGSENYDYSSTFGEFALKSKLTKQKSFLFADMRFRGGLFYNERETTLQIKEVYAGYRGSKVDLFLGNQIVTWGRTDGFNPTNNITPNDYFFLTPDPDDQNLSNFMLRNKIRLANQIDMEVIAIPFYLPSIYRYDLFSMGAGANFKNFAIPETNFENSTLASRLNFELPSIGFSVSYFRGYDPFYGFTLIDFQFIPLEINYQPTPYFKNSVGIDFALPIYKWIIRGEGAWSITEDFENQMHIPNPDFSYVFGLERNISGYVAIFQYVGKYTLDFKDLTPPVLAGNSQEDFIQYANERVLYESTFYNRKIFSQQEKTNHALMLSISKSFLHEELSIYISGYYNLTTEEYLIRPNVKWSITDELSASIGASYMLGPDNSLYDIAGKVINGAYLGLMVKF
jgi:hypothetical protein